MLNIINLYKKDHVVRYSKKEGSSIKVHKRDIPLSKEWYNSLYTFNSNSIRFLPAVHNYVFKLLRSYFNMTNIIIEKNVKFRWYKKIKGSSGNKVWISTPEIKHINEKVGITVYIYNRLYNQHKNDLALHLLDWGPKKFKFSLITKRFVKQLFYNLDREGLKEKEIWIKSSLKRKLIRKKKTILLGHKSIMYFKTSTPVNIDDSVFYAKIIKLFKLNKDVKMQHYKLDISRSVQDNKINSSVLLRLLRYERFNYLINQFKKELTYMKLKQKILFNRFKFNELYLHPLINCLQMIYKKKVEFNFVIIKNYFLSSSILSQIAVTKIKSIKNRGRSWKPVNLSLAYIKVPFLSRQKLPKIDKTTVGMQNVVLNKLADTNEKRDQLNEFILKYNINSKIWSSKFIDRLALRNIENKSVAGVFIKTTGRLTKRYKAQRAINTLKYRGTLRNPYSAHQGFTSALSRGYGNINVEKTFIHSKVRIGAFGLTGWVSSY